MVSGDRRAVVSGLWGWGWGWGRSRRPGAVQDPTYTLSGFLKTYGKIREEFRNVDLERPSPPPPSAR